MTAPQYRRAVGELYFRFTSNRLNRYDRLFVDELFSRRVSLDIVRSALLLASARRLARNPNAPPLPPVRSFHYFRNVIDEVAQHPLPRGYIEYVQRRLDLMTSEKNT